MIHMWLKYKLSEIGTIIGGATPSTAVEAYYNGNIPWLTPKDLSDFNGRYIEKGERNISELGLKNCSAQLLPAGSVLFSSRAPIGYVAIAKNPIATNQGFKSIIPDKKKINSLFLYYLLKFNKNKIEALGSGTTFKEVSASIMKNVEVCIPSLKEQQQIADILSSFDDKIELNRRINENLEQQAQALFKSWFVDFEPFKNGKFIDSELGKIPEGWKVGSIGDYCKIRSGFAFKSSWWTDKGIKIVKIKNISSSGNLDMNDCSYVSKENIFKAKEFSLKSGDLLIAMTGATIGKFCIVPVLQEEMYVNQRVGKFFLGENPILKVPFIYGLLKGENIITQIINKGQGSAQPNISANDIESIPIILPIKEIISEYNKLASPYFSLLIENLNECDYLENLRDTLLPKLMSGEIKI